MTLVITSAVDAGQMWHKHSVRNLYCYCISCSESLLDLFSHFLMLAVIPLTGLWMLWIYFQCFSFKDAQLWAASLMWNDAMLWLPGMSPAIQDLYGLFPPYVLVWGRHGWPSAGCTHCHKVFADLIISVLSHMNYTEAVFLVGVCVCVMLIWAYRCYMHMDLYLTPRGPPSHGSCAGMLCPARAQQMEARAVECGVNADRWGRGLGQ